MKHGQRGQALVETAIFLPVVLLILFGIVYFSRLGVLSERVQSAVRYGTLISFNSAQVYSGADIYNGLSSASPSALCPPAVATDTSQAVTHANAPSGSASPVPFWRPDVAASATCSVSTISFTGPPYQSVHIFTVTRDSAIAGVAVSPYLQSFLGTTNNAGATLGYMHSDPPSVILYCLGSLGSAVATALQTTYGGGGSC
ncbi:MAG: TadE/TadG family type IV pilus assembly protein [Candidatus Baltobacteraceae bacterium]